MTLRRTTLAAVATLAVTALVAAGCGDGAGTGADQSSVDRGSAAPTTSAQDPTHSQTDSEAQEPDQNQENSMQIQISIRDQTFTATLRESAAADDLVAQLPVTVEMVDHGGVEKTGRLPTSLSLAGQPDGADPDVADLGYYAPGNDLVLYYGDQSYFRGIVVLGTLDGDAAERIASMDGAVTATVEPR